jgi:hypothetical protein
MAFLNFSVKVAVNIGCGKRGQKAVGSRLGLECNRLHYVSYPSCMTAEEARQIIVEGINYAAYKETDTSLYDSDKNRLFGSDHYNSGRHIVKPSPWSEGNFEEKMAMLLRWANTLNASVPTFAQAQSLLETEGSVLGRVIRLSKVNQGR